MGNEAEFHFGKKRSREGLEFVGGQSRRPTFRQRVARIEYQSPAAPELAPAPEVFEQPVAPEALIPAQPEVVDPLAHLYQEPMLAAPQEPLEELFTDDLPVPTQSKVETRIELHDEPKHPSRFRRVFSYATAAVALIVLSTSSMFLLQNTPTISAALRKKADFNIHEVVANRRFKVDKESVVLNKEGNLVYFVDNVENKAHFVVSQQKVPDVVKNDADYKQFLADFDKYAEFNSQIGRAYFTHPANIGSDISVVVKTNSTLMFIRGPGTTTDSDWTELLSYFRVIK